MTSDKHLKARIRARMAKTGERYTTARRHILGHPDQPVVDHGWTLRGGVHPETANVANLLAHQGRVISEAMVFGIGGGLGAGYILWEFQQHRSVVLTLWFRHRAHYLDSTERTLDRLGVPYTVSRTSGVRTASRELTAALDAGTPAIVLPDRQILGYWGLPEHLNGQGGHQVVAYAAVDGAVRLDERNSAPLSVDREVLGRARARVVSYRNYLVVVTGPGADIDLRPAVVAGIRDCVSNHGGTSDSFALPAWRKWARMLTDQRNAKAWPRVFADGHGLFDALLSVWEGVEPIGMTGGHLRGLYATFLDEAADLLGVPDLRAVAEAFRVAADRWHAVAETALPAGVPEHDRARELTAALAAGVAAGDAGAADRAVAAAELWDLRSRYRDKPPAAPDLAALAARVGEAYETERDAVAALAVATRQLT